MGYETQSNGIRTFWPDDTDTEFYIAGDATIAEILQTARLKWPDLNLADEPMLTITPEFIHTDCLGYDLMDWGDYTNFLRISKRG